MSALLTVAHGIPALLAEGKDNPSADFSDTPLWITVIKALFIFVYLLVSTLIVIWFERRVIGRMQQRPGPNRNGPFGLLQSLADGMKSMLKEDVRPKAADALVFTIAPLITATMCFFWSDSPRPLSMPWAMLSDAPMQVQVSSAFQGWPAPRV